jgi:SAM-dependent methyltransferase
MDFDAGDPMTVPPDFYRAFEERFRGERADIKGRMSIYQPFLDALRAHFGSASAIDLGCGRGEWLEVLRDAGWPGHGVDLDQAMLAACRDAGLDAVRGDALETLRGLPEASQGLVSAFHLVEHLPFEALHDLVRESLRVLKPGGLLLIETPNPENIVVGASRFYMDPTHIRPLPPPLLAFVADYYGFEAVKVLRVQEPEWIRESPSPLVLHVLRDSSPDYAVMAQKGGDADAHALLQPLFAREYGITMETLAHRQEAFVQYRFDRLSDLANHAVHLADQASETARRALAGNAQNKEDAAAAMARAKDAEMQVHLLRSSLSWRITAPLRAVASLFMRSSRSREEK